MFLKYKGKMRKCSFKLQNYIIKAPQQHGIFKGVVDIL